MLDIFWNVIGIILFLLLLASAVRSAITLYASIKTRHMPSIIINMMIMTFIILFIIFVMRPTEIITEICKFL